MPVARPCGVFDSNGRGCDDRSGLRSANAADFARHARCHGPDTTTSSQGERLPVFGGSAMAVSPLSSAPWVADRSTHPGTAPVLRSHVDAESAERATVGGMPNLVILSKQEEEYLVRAIESGLNIQRLRQFFVWVRSHVQGLLPHETMVCVQFGERDEVQHLECLNGLPLDVDEHRHLCDPADGLVVRMARLCRSKGPMPCLIAPDRRDAWHPLPSLADELASRRVDKVLLHGSERMPGGATFFALLAWSDAPTTRHAYLLSLLMPYLHTAFLQVIANGDATEVRSGLPQTLTAREIEVLGWVARGKSNAEIGEILGLSSLTVKNHLQRIYKRLNVHNRVQALARCDELHLLGGKSP